MSSLTLPVRTHPSNTTGKDLEEGYGPGKGSETSCQICPFHGSLPFLDEAVGRGSCAWDSAASRKEASSMSQAGPLLFPDSNAWTVSFPLKC